MSSKYVLNVYLCVSLTLICTCVLYGLHVTLVLHTSGFVFIATRVLGFGVQLESFQRASIQQPPNIDTLLFSTPEIRYCTINFMFGKGCPSNATWDGGVYSGHI